MNTEWRWSLVFIEKFQSPNPPSHHPAHLLCTQLEGGVCLLLSLQIHCCPAEWNVGLAEEPTPVIWALGRSRQEAHPKLEPSLVYLATCRPARVSERKSLFKKKKQTKKTKAKQTTLEFDWYLVTALEVNFVLSMEVILWICLPLATQWSRCKQSPDFSSPTRQDSGNFPL